MTTRTDENPLAHIFFPHAVRQVRRISAEGGRFVHYTSADAALSIIGNAEVWMRKSSCMDDYSEVRYGMHCLKQALASEKGRHLQALLEGMFEGFTSRFNPLFGGWAPHFETDTYLTCVSEHDRKEDKIGRLSMWRSFGSGTRVALVFSNAPFIGVSDALKAYSSPVAYLTPDDFESEFIEMVAAIEANAELLRKSGEEAVQNSLFNSLRFAALCTKHPGFHEEREWRIVYSPRMNFSDRIQPGVHSFNGVPQPIQKLPLKNVPEEGLVGAELPELLDRVIVGPTQYPDALHQVFLDALSKAGVKTPSDRIWISDIPIRQQS